MLDVDCFSAHPVAVAGSPPHPVLSHKTRLRLDRASDRHDRLRRDGACHPRRRIPRLAALPPPGRARLPGISRRRAERSSAGAPVAEALVVATGHDEVEICPWSTREGLLLSLAGAGVDENCRVA